MANLVTKKVSTVAGTGAEEYYYKNQKVGEPVNPNSPWDLQLVKDALFVASSGNHQILKLDLATNKLTRFAGNGKEALETGSLLSASFSQPSGLGFQGDSLFVVDPEASAVRVIDLKQQVVSTLLGQGLFKFGDVDGPLASAKLQHSMAVLPVAGFVFIADSYNGKIKAIDLARKTISTVAAGFDEPNDILLIGKTLYVTETNKHKIWAINLTTNTKTEVVIQK